MNILEEYIDTSVKIIMKMDSSLDKKDIEKIVKRKVKERLKDPTIVMDNNVTGENYKTTLTELCTWLGRSDSIISGNATFYVQPSVLESPTANMLRALKRSRKEVKKRMFQAINNGDMVLYKKLDLIQLNIKVIMNAEYGASGAPTAAFYTKYSPAATTLMAQSIITTMAAFFEGYVGDNQKFYNANECFDWMNQVISKNNKIHNWIKIPSKLEVKNRIKKHFIMYDDGITESLDMYIDSCTDKELVYLYYANNFKDLISSHKKLQELINMILTKLPNYEAVEKNIPDEFKNKFSKVNDYNGWVSSEMFLNPYEIPKIINTEMNELISIMNQYVYVKYITPDSIAKLNNHTRNAIMLVDTDSNVINSDLFVDFILTNIFGNNTYGRKKMYNEMISVNILASILDDAVTKLLYYYCECHNIPENVRSELTMKNEFMFRRFFLMMKKKRYAASLALREGNILMPFKTEIKGVDFIKAGVSDDVTKRFTKILEDHILFSEEVELHKLMVELKKFEKEIYLSLRNGDGTYLKPQQYKPEAAYKNPWGIPVFRAAYVWNTLYPEQKIYSMDRVKIVKTRVTSIKDIEILKDNHPEIYTELTNKIFNSKNPDVIKAGLKVIGIPSTVDNIPDWILPIIDYDVIVSDVMNSFKSVIDALGIEGIRIKTPNGQANKISALVSI